PRFVMGSGGQAPQPSAVGAADRAVDPVYAVHLRSPRDVYGVHRTCRRTEDAMQAMVQDRYGSADVLELRDIGAPTLNADQVLVRVRAAGLDAGVWHLMTGRPYFMRLMGFGLRRPTRNPVPGREVSGVVEQVGAEVTGLRPGDEVVGICDGSFAEFVATRS